MEPVVPFQSAPLISCQHNSRRLRDSGGKGFCTGIRVRYRYGIRTEARAVLRSRAACPGIGICASTAGHRQINRAGGATVTKHIHMGLRQNERRGLGDSGGKGFGAGIGIRYGHRISSRRKARAVLRGRTARPRIRVSTRAASDRQVDGTGRSTVAEHIDMRLG